MRLRQLLEKLELALADGDAAHTRGLGRYARIFMRAKPDVTGAINMPVACVTDLDVMPDDAPWIVGKLKQGETIPPIVARGRQWRVKADFSGTGLETRRMERRMKASGQCVETFVANQWTLEFDLAYYGLRLSVWLAVHFALADDKLVDGKTTKKDVALACSPEFFSLVKRKLSVETFSAHVYSNFEKDNPSKAIAAQYLAEHLEDLIEKGKMDAISLLKRLPPYVVQAIEHVTEPFPDEKKGNADSIGALD